MDQTLLRGRGLHPEVVGPATLAGYRLHIGERATLLPSPSNRACGIVMELSDSEARELYSEPSVRDYQRERVRVELVDTGEPAEVDCFNLPPGAGGTGANPGYAAKLSRLARTLDFDPAYLKEIAAFG